LSATLKVADVALKGCELCEQLTKTP